MKAKELAKVLTPAETTITQTVKLTPAQIESNKHDEWVEEQFKGGTGGFSKLTIMVKNSLNDPNSFEYVSRTKSFDKDDLIIIMKYRAKNAFSAKILLEVKARVSYKDNSVTIIE